MNRKITAIAVVMVLAVNSIAQTALTSLHNGFRDGDKLYRIIAKSTSVGEGGKDCVWKLPAAREDESCLRQVISLRNDSLTITEGDLLLHYIATDKELSMCGFQRRDMYSVHDKTLPELRYPFDSIADTYSRRTTYYDTFTMEGKGTCYTVCDGIGVLTDGNETLEGVLRIHHHNTIVSEYSSFVGDEEKTYVSEVIEDKYLWYYPGCRYPVMDTRILSNSTNGKLVADTTFTSLYMPELQVYELAYDDANSLLLAQRDDTGRSVDPSESSIDDEAQFPIKMNASLLSDECGIRLSYTVEGDVDATFYAYDLAGRILGTKSHVSLSTGEHNETMLLDKRPINNIVMLVMVAADRQFVVKVH